MLRQKIYLLLFSLVTVFSACHPTKYLEKDQMLYNGAVVKRAKPSKDQPKSSLRSALNYKIRQQPNKKIFGKRFKLWVYQQFINHKKEKGFRNWLKTRIGEPPSIYNHRLTEESRLSIQQSLRDNGFLNAVVTTDTIMKNKMVSVRYFIDGKGQFYVNEYKYPPDTTVLLSLINEEKRKPIIQKGKPFSIIDVNKERLRIEGLAKNNGFYEFDQSALYFYIDTAVEGSRKLDVFLSVKSPTDQKDYQRYELGNVNIYPDYSLSKPLTVGENIDTIEEGHWKLIQKKKIVRLKAFQEAITQDSGAVYNQRLERQAINHLLDFGIFKYVNLKYEKVMKDSQAILFRNFYLTPALNQDFGVELEATSERSSFLGSSVGLNYTHRNLFHGAEEFKTSLSFGAETQNGGGGPFVNTLEAKFRTGLSFPRLLLPFKITKRINGAIPKTLINVNTSYQKRNTLFTSASVLTELGYSWKQTQNFQHQFYPLQFTLLKLLNTSTDFENELILNPRLKASFDDILILAANYRLSYTNQQLNIRNNFSFFRTEIETAGNIASLIGMKQSGDPDAPKTLLKTSIAQYVKLQAEWRYTLYQPKTSFVTRISSGVVFPYGNSEAVPYVRQFFVGGASSNRAFRFRGIGPGSYSPDESRDTTSFAFFDRVGDLKLELNLEYRFPLPISEYLNGAVFVDVGNVWLTKKAGDELPEGQFEFNRFYKELAIGAGFGFRLDIQYVVIRFDFGIPISNPSLPEKERWLVPDIQLAKRAWRKENLIFNLAIGYPF